METAIRDLCKQIIQPIFFVTPDINWAIGLETLLPNYHIICWEDNEMVDLVKENCKVLCLQKEFPDIKVEKNTGSMLALPQVQSYISEHSKGQQPAVMYFKSSPKIDKLCDELRYLQVGNRAELSRRFEDKLALVEMGKQYPELQVMPGEAVSLQHLQYPVKLPRVKLGYRLVPSSSEEREKPSPFRRGLGEVKREQDQGWIIQFPRGWAGRSTYLITNEEELRQLKEQKGDQMVKVSSYIQGWTYINNACVLADGKVLQSPPAEQIMRPDPEFSSLPFATCGRQWPAGPDRDVNWFDKAHHRSYVFMIQTITELVGNLFHLEGYFGYFGLDFLVKEDGDKVYLLEINPRLTASSSFYTQLELRNGQAPLLLYHLLSFLPEFSSLITQLPDYQLSEITGTQLLVRNNLIKAFSVQQNLQTGIYSQTDMSPTGFVKSAYRLEELQPDQVIIKTHQVNTEISVESEIFSIETLEPLLENHKLSKSLIKKLLSLKHLMVKQ